MVLDNNDWFHLVHRVPPGNALDQRAEAVTSNGHVFTKDHLDFSKQTVDSMMEDGLSGEDVTNGILPSENEKTFDSKNTATSVNDQVPDAEKSKDIVNDDGDLFNETSNSGSGGTSAKENSSSSNEDDTKAKLLRRKRKSSQDLSAKRPKVANVNSDIQRDIQNYSSSSDSEDVTNHSNETSSQTLDSSGKGGQQEANSDPKARRKKSKAKNMRRNIKDVLKEDELEKTTKDAQQEEMERLKRLQEQRKQRLEEAFLAEIQERQLRQLQQEQERFEMMAAQQQNPADSRLTYQSSETPPVVDILSSTSSSSSSSSGDEVSKSGSDSSDCKVISDVDLLAEEDEDDENNSGMHVEDHLNVPDPKGRVLVNIGHPEREPDIFLVPQLSHAVKPHQIGGIRFLYDNIIESLERFHESEGLGCILAHSMGLGKTIQIIAFCDVFIRSTKAKHILCIVPINTIQNWVSEFNYWLPDNPEATALKDKGEVTPREFKIHVLNDLLKNLEQRAKVILEWKNEGGVLLMGYELYRQLAHKKPRKRKKKNNAPELIDLEEEDKNKSLLDDIQTALVNPGPDLVVCDEGHRIKNSHASISQALKSIKTRRRIVLTGYPLQNNLMEYWCMVDFVRPNFLGTKTEFSNMFERPIQNGQCLDSTPSDVRLMMHRAHVLHTQLKGFVQRRGHKVLQESLPTKSEHVLLVRMTPIQRRLYRRFMDDLLMNKSVSNPLKAFAVCCKIWNHPDVLHIFLKKKEAAEDFDLEVEELTENSNQVGKGSFRKPKPNVASQSVPPTPASSTENSLISCGPGFNPFGDSLSNASTKKDEINYDWAQNLLTDYVPGILDNSSKFVVFFSILEETVKSGDRLLLFSQSLLTLNLLEDFLQQMTLPGTNIPWRSGMNYFRLDGSTPAMERERLIKLFNDAPNDVSLPGAIPLFIVSTRAGSLGINLVGANRVVVLDASWNPCHDSQAVCRVYRYGQFKESFIYRLVTDNSIEKKIYDRQVNKQGMADRVVDEQNPDNHLSSKDINSLICENEMDPSPSECEQKLSDEVVQGFDDPVLRNVIQKNKSLLTKPPFKHESLLIDRKEKKLSKAEKRLAERSYQMEKGSRISYTRPSYAAFYPKSGQSAANLNNPGSLGFARNRYFDSPRQNLSSFYPNDSRFSQASSTSFPDTNWGNYAGNSMLRTTFSNFLSTQGEPNHQNFFQQPNEHIRQPPVTMPSSQESSQSSTPDLPKAKTFPINALAKKGVAMEHVVVPKDIVIPTNSPEQPPISLKAGQNVMIIRTPKGTYIKMGEKIIKIKSLPGFMTNKPSSSSDVINISSSSESNSASENEQKNGDGRHQGESISNRKDAIHPAAKDLLELVARASGSGSDSNQGS